jgi:N-hydroxyarylamine O-acetyltransferase
MMDDSTLAAYFRRLAVRRPHTADAVSLHVLHRAHQMTVPFENLSIHLSEPISLAEDDLIDKIVTRRRGGFCYELNGAFAFLLQAMGAEVKRVAARVYGDGRAGPPFDHMVLVVHASDASGPWLIDVGFGSHSVYPLLFDSRHGQDDPAGSFLLVDTEDGDVDVLKDGKAQYRIEPRERALADFVPTCWWQQTAPESHFTRSTICSRLTNGGRVSISGRTLITTEGGSRSEQYLPDAAAVLTAYRDHFGIVLDQAPHDPAAPSADAASPPAVRSVDAVPSTAPTAPSGSAAIPPDGPSTPAASSTHAHPPAPPAPPAGQSSPAHKTSPASSGQGSPPARL